jgi:RND family efflux transporter MFP subunit
MAEVFESDAARVQVGQWATVSLSYLAGRGFRGRVSYILPQLDPTTRTLKVRLDADNPGLLLKPEMYVDVEFRVALGGRLTVPSEAVLDSGLKKTVFVDRGNGYFEPREVVTGQSIGDRIEILRGLKAGDRVVTSGNFLVDSESQLKAATSGSGGGAHQHD